MASELLVNKITPESGTTLTIGDSGDNVGVGVSNPSVAFEVNTGANGRRIMFTQNAGNLNEIRSTTSDQTTYANLRYDAVEHIFETSDTEIARFTSAGLAIGGTGSANTLDDYEEGTFTPTLSFGTASTQVGSYIKVGNVCHCFMNIVDLTDTTTASGISITLPFTCKSGDDYQSVATVMYRNVTLLNNSSISGFLNDNQSNLLMYQDNAGGNWSLLTYSEITGVNGSFKIQLTYFTA